MTRLKLGFLGFGLIGGSIAKALKKSNADIHITVYSRRKNPDLDSGVQEGVIDDLVYSIDDHFSSCDIIFLCAPVRKNIEFLSILKNIINPSCIITDVGSVKGSVCEAAKKEGLEEVFIGGHPMAGSEKTGYANSFDLLLENAYYLLTPSEKNNPADIEKLRELVKLTGANCVVLTPDQHDRITAAISHVPHIIAASLVNMVKNLDDGSGDIKSFAAGGFRDITRIASSSPEMWRDICVENSVSIDVLLTDFENLIKEFKKHIINKDLDALYSSFYDAGEYRDSLPTGRNSLLSRSYEIFVNIADQPGTIAEVANLLSKEKINIRNIGIVNNREFIDGVLRIEFAREDEADKSKDILINNGYSLSNRR